MEDLKALLYDLYKYRVFLSGPRLKSPLEPLLNPSQLCNRRRGPPEGDLREC